MQLFEPELHSPSPAHSLLRDFEHYLRRTLAKDRYTATDRDRYQALALAVRDRLVERWIATQQTHHKRNVKRIYYFSLEFLIGRLLANNVINLKLEDDCREALSTVGLDWESLRDHEVDAGLGNTLLPHGVFGDRLAKRRA